MYNYHYSYGFDDFGDFGSGAAVGAAVAGVLVILLVILLALAVVMYVFQSLGLYTMAKRRGHQVLRPCMGSHRRPLDHGQAGRPV